MKAIVNRIYQGKSVLPRSPKDQIIREMAEFVSELVRTPITTNATVNQ